MTNPNAGWKKLPKPLDENYRWQEEGICRGMDSDVFFLPDNCRTEQKYLRIEKAKSICYTCPVLDTCREFSITTEQPYGVWGGLSEEERQFIIRRKKRHKQVG